MKLVIRFAVLLLCLLVPAALTAQTVDVDWVHGTDFSRFHTFTWATGAYPIQDPDASLGMALAVQNELEAKGVQYVGPQEKFDAFVTYNVKTNPDPQDSSRTIVTVKLSIFDARNNSSVWRAGGYFTATSDKAENRRNVRALLAEMFRQYPPE
jgi:uncharacterized protein DUF4136